jgi:hypothetical protein
MGCCSCCDCCGTLNNCHELRTQGKIEIVEENETSLHLDINQNKFFGSSVIGHRSDYPLDIIKEKSDDVQGVLSFSECATNCLHKDIKDYNYYIHKIPGDENFPNENRILMCNNTNESIYTYTHENLGESKINPSHMGDIIHNNLGTEYITVDRGLCNDKESKTMDNKIHDTYPDAFNSLIHTNTKDDNIDMNFKKLKKLYYLNDDNTCELYSYEEALKEINENNIRINPDFFDPESNDHKNKFYLELPDNIFENKKCE